MAETNYVIINSKFKKQGSISTSDFTFSLGEVLEINDVAIKSVSLVNAEYNVKAGSNIIIVSDGTTESTLILEVGQYTIDKLLEELRVKLFSVYGVTSTAVVNAITNKVNITQAGSPIQFSTSRVRSPLSFILGFGQETALTEFFPITPSVSILAPLLPNLQGANNYHIVSSTIGQGVGSLLKNNDKRPIILTIPVTKNFGEVINYEVNEIKLNQRHFTRPINLQEIDIKVIDDDNELVNLQGTNIEIVLQVRSSAIMPFSIQGNQMHYN